MAQRKRSKQVKIYLSDDEYNAYMEQVNLSRLSQTDFFVRCVCKKKIYVIDGLRETLIELKKIGVNLNQISKNLNGGFFQNADKELAEIKMDFRKLKASILVILKGVK